MIRSIILFADVNMVAEPKPHQTGRKRQNVTKTGNDWYVYMYLYYYKTFYIFYGDTKKTCFTRRIDCIKETQLHCKKKTKKKEEKYICTYNVR